MKNTKTCNKNLSSLLKKIHQKPTPAPSDFNDPIEVLIRSFLMWESTTELADKAYDQLHNHIVDFNDLRVSMPQEIIEGIGEDYPRALDRAQRIRATLRDIYNREHAVNLDRLSQLGKREVKKYLESADGITPYVASRVMLLCFATHAMPIDDQLRTLLINIGAADDSAETPELTSWLSRQIKADDGPSTHFALQAWADKEVARLGQKKKTKTTRKKQPSGK